uniref:Uncharacterized protein n=1 Tax=Oryza brachyantha TaxID=4533 RepID=J3LRH3_ORYBR
MSAIMGSRSSFTLINVKIYILNKWDVGGQKTVRSYWRNYFEQTDRITLTVQTLGDLTIVVLNSTIS